MKLFENYNSAVQKYDKNLVVCFSKQGLPPQYLLSACRFVQNEGASIDIIVPQFKEWTRYVVKYNKQCDVNRFSYSDFLEMIAKQKRLHSVPNLIYKDKTASLGKLNSAKDVQLIPVRNQWCIKSQKWFDNYTSKGYVFFVIYLPNEPLPFTYVIAAIHGGNVEYYDSQDYEQFEDLRGGNENNSDHEIYQRKLPQEIISYLYNIAAEQGEKLESMNYNENRQYKMKQKIRLTEGDLHRIIRKCVNEATKKDPMKQWFKDMENASEYRERMDYITKGGRKPISRKSNGKIDEETNIPIEHKKRLCQLVKERAYEIQRIINNMTESGPNGKNYLVDLIADEPWFKQLKDAVFDMESYGKQYDEDYGSYEDDPIYC